MKKTLLFLTVSILFSCGPVLSLQEKLIQQHPEWTNQQIQQIKAHNVSLGMTTEMVKASWGKPDYTNVYDSAYMGKGQAWTYYHIFGTKLRTVTFEKGKVKSYSDGAAN